MIVTFLFRISVALQPGYHQPDEIWQYVEPAWGWATGRWIQTWEFHVGLRGWLVPMVFRPIMGMGLALGLGGAGTLALLRLILAMLALVVPYTFWRLGKAISPIHGLIAAWVGAIWPEIFYFAARSSGENLATIAIFAAILAIYDPPRTDAPQRAGRERARLAWIGLCLALGFIIRFQYLPAIGLLALASVYKSPVRRSPWVLLGGLVGLGLGAAADLIASQPPLGWLLTNFNMNFSQNRSAFFGTKPIWWYGQQIGLTWSVGALLFVPAIVVSARRYPMLLVVALVTLFTHSLIPHKEYRFILLAQLLFIFMAAIGSLDLVNAAAARWKVRPIRPARVMGALAAIWLAFAVLTSVTKPFIKNWGNGRGIASALAVAGRDPGLCGIAVYRARAHPIASYALLGRNVPILLIDGPQARLTAAENAGQFNSIFAPRSVEGDLPKEFHLAECQSPNKPPKSQYYCVFKRAGSCTKAPTELDYNASLTRLGY
ncbi:Alg9-like mannosyltransferase [Novosphingobium sp. Rr 2-17]|nr:Alg9-like mannosyltransferase [Novosphingobium sp. Rr 2-17]